MCHASCCIPTCAHDRGSGSALRFFPTGRTMVRPVLFSSHILTMLCDHLQLSIAQSSMNCYHPISPMGETAHPPVASYISNMEWNDRMYDCVCVCVSACPANVPCLLFVLVLVSCFVVSIVCPGAVPIQWCERAMSLHHCCT